MADGGWGGPDRLSQVRAWLDRHIRPQRSNPWKRQPPWAERLAVVAAAVVASVVVLYALAAPGRDTDTFEATDTRGSTTTSTTTSTTAVSDETTTTTTTMSPTTLAVPTTVTVTTVAAPSTTPTTRSPAATTSLPATTVRLTTTSTSTTVRFGPLCGYAPGARIAIEFNGRPAGTETADEKGCVPVTITPPR